MLDIIFIICPLLVLLGVGDLILPHIPFVRDYIDSLDDYEDDEEE